MRKVENGTVEMWKLQICQHWVQLIKITNDEVTFNKMSSIKYKAMQLYAIVFVMWINCIIVLPSRIQYTQSVVN